MVAVLLRQRRSLDSLLLWRVLLRIVAHPDVRHRPNQQLVLRHGWHSPSSWMYAWTNPNLQSTRKADWRQLIFGRFSRHFRQIVSRSRGTVALSRRGGTGSSATTISTVSIAVAAW